jgi:hypothetical protein
LTLLVENIILMQVKNLPRLNRPIPMKKTISFHIYAILSTARYANGPLGACLGANHKKLFIID